jgi:hypothetical protein
LLTRKKKCLLQEKIINKQKVFEKNKNKQMFLNLISRIDFVGFVLGYGKETSVGNIKR